MKFVLILAVFCASAYVAMADGRMSTFERYRSIKKVCDIRSDELWEKAIKCHYPINDQFLRESDEANCPRKSSDPDPRNTSVPMVRVFKTLCNLFTLNPFSYVPTSYCLYRGHAAEVKKVQDRWGQKVPENIGKCVRALNLN